MAVVNCPDRLISMQVQKRFGRPNQYGQIVYGYSVYGEKNDYAGIYQTRPSKSGRVNVKMKFYFPNTNPRPGGDAWRAVFASAISAWQSLSTSEKHLFHLKSMGKHMSGYNVFLHEYLIIHRII